MPHLSVAFDGAQLEQARYDRDVPQYLLAGIAGLSIESVRRAEHGDQVSIDTARAICTALTVPMERFVRSVGQAEVDDADPWEAAEYQR
jgi:transcriptional regulator with XRE-family HTH domain